MPRAFLAKYAKKELDKLPVDDRRRIARLFRNLEKAGTRNSIAVDSATLKKPLFLARSGAWRAVYEVDTDGLVVLNVFRKGASNQ